MSRNRKRTFRSAAWDGFAGYMETKKRKLNEQFVHSDSLNESLTPVSCIFDGVTIYVNGYTDPCADDLKRLMKLHGGQYAYFYSKSQVTHMIANNLPDTKIKDLRCSPFN
jgi:DNA repair protein REV1